MATSVESLVAMRYPSERFAVHVVADNCTDATAAVARAAGATVHERDAPDDRGKGAALNWVHDRLVAEEKVGGVATDHVAFRGDTADLQLWIAHDGNPLPQRIVITYRLAEGQPQFQADFYGWNLEPDAPDALFTFTPATGAERIPILAPGREKPAAEKKP